MFHRYTRRGNRVASEDPFRPRHGDVLAGSGERSSLHECLIAADGAYALVVRNRSAGYFSLIGGPARYRLVLCSSFDALVRQAFSCSSGQPLRLCVDKEVQAGSLIDARQVFWLIAQTFGGTLEMLALDPKGRLVDLIGNVNALRKARYASFQALRFPSHVFRASPVDGVHRRVRYSKILRKPATKQERTQSVGVELAEGEPLARAARSNRYLPSSWDDIVRERQRSWKTQHKGRKAWDRG